MSMRSTSRQAGLAGSGAARSLHINTSHDRMPFAAFRMPRSLPDFPAHERIASISARTSTSSASATGSRSRPRSSAWALPRTAPGRYAGERRGALLRRADRGERAPLGPALAGAAFPGQRGVRRGCRSIRTTTRAKTRNCSATGTSTEIRSNCTSCRPPPTDPCSAAPRPNSNPPQTAGGLSMTKSINRRTFLLGSAGTAIAAAMPTTAPAHGSLISRNHIGNVHWGLRKWTGGFNGYGMHEYTPGARRFFPVRTSTGSAIAGRRLFGTCWSPRRSRGSD